MKNDFTKYIIKKEKEDNKKIKINELINIIKNL